MPAGLKTPNGSPNQKPLPDVEVRSQEVQEIIGNPPHWLIRAGIGGFTGVLLLILFTAAFIEYPEVITSPVTLTAINAPKTVETKVNGKIIKLFKPDKSEIEKGQVIGWMESTAHHASVQQLRAETDSLYRWLETGDFDNMKNSGVLNIQHLGELQPGFEAFNTAFRDFLLYVPGGFHDQRKSILEKEHRYIRELLIRLEEQKNIQVHNYELARREYEAQQKLADKELIAELDLLNAESALSNRRLPLEQVASAIINNRLISMAKEKEIMELDWKINEQKAVFVQVLNSLKSAIEEWRNSYVLVAPLTGTLTYAGIVQELQTYTAGQTVFYIDPGNTDFFGEMSISQRSFGKIEEGQQVLVRFSGYPYHEYGAVEGIIEYISDFPVGDSLFYGKVHFPMGMTTNYGKLLTPANGMNGQAEIITQDLRLLERVYNNLTKEMR